ncbi:hypothetical protein SAMN05216223_102438 [Actinacidiphila yanglinensis]|uniref:Uncharacterized protein n=1 Tax=Actinacidiphila yanglinensis TaxID=310779 RepID=A0A1H5VUW4_9ACTN|nr:hypothetical protein [Actinacidiphila yanglinensis]SEF90758.1 hypothetical protein SAMN05216223_102438 [Actinacidiphila yanglinensis]
MDSYEGAASLDWWANRSTCLGSYGVRVAVRVTGDDWTCEATLEPRLSAEDQEGFDFLMELDPFFTLRFDDESTVLVDVVATGEGEHLVLTAFRDEATEAGSRRIPT